MTLSNRTFGLELEVLGNMRNAYLALDGAGIPVSMTGYTHRATATWKLVPDGSVSGGFEVVSPVLRGEAGIEQARAVCAVLTANGNRVDRSCGFHVHVGAADLTGDDLRSLAKRYAAWEAEIDGWMPATRRGNANMYCQPMQRIADQIDRVPAGTDRDGLLAQVVGRHSRDGRRYHKLNLQAFWMHSTVEFRQHSGTVDADKVENWTRFCVAFVEASRNAGSTSAYQPNPDYRRQARRNYAEVIEQVEAAGLSIALTAPGARTYRISGPGGTATVSTTQLGRLYTAPSAFTLDAVRFEAWWTFVVAPLLPRPAAPDAVPQDSVFAGVADPVRAFFAARARYFAGRRAP